MAAKDSDETAAMFSPKRPRIDTDAVLLQHRPCSKVVNPLEKTSDTLIETPVDLYFNNRLSCSDVGNANPQVHHHYNDDDNEEKEKNQIINKNNNKEDPMQQSMEEEAERYNDVHNHTNMGDGDEDKELEEGRRQQGAAKNDKNTEQIFTADEKEMDNNNLSFSHDPDLENPDDDNLDNVSEISELAALDEEAWRPVSGPLNWVQRQMSMGRDPRMLFKELISPETFIPPDLDEMTLWGLLANFITEPPKRKKLNHINSIDDVVTLLKTSKKIMVLTGAGVSVSCGIPDFRSRDGIYARLAVDFPDLPDPQAMFDINYFRNDPRPFFKFAKEIYPGQFEPSKCHKFIKLIEDHSRLLHNYTQNIDTLEQQAGIKKVIQCHGSFATATCMNCSFKLNAAAIRDDIFKQVIPKCPKCPPDSTTAIMKPDIVFFGENLPEHFHYQMAEDKEQCDLLIVIGSSMKVRPVALIPNYIPAHVPQILINREPLSHMTFDVELLGDGDIIVNDLCKRLGEGWKEAFCDPDPVSAQITKDQLEISPSLSEFSEKSQNQPSENSIQNKMENSSKGLSVDDVSENDAKLSENGQINSSFCKKSAENGSCSEVKIPNNSETSHTCEKNNENCKMEENGENIDTLKSLWKKNKHRKQSLARHLKDNQVLFLPPCQYAYPGAEIYSEDEEEEEEDILEESESHNSDSSSSWESFSDEEDKKLSENGIGNSLMLYPNNISSVDLYPPHPPPPAAAAAASAAAAAAVAAACGGADDVSGKGIMSTDLKSSSDMAALNSSSILTALQNCKADGQLTLEGDSLLQGLCNPMLHMATEKDDSKTISSCVTLHEGGQQNGCVGNNNNNKTEDIDSSAATTAAAASTAATAAAAVIAHQQHSNEMSVGATKNQCIRTEDLVNSFLSTQQATAKKYTEMDTVSSSTLTLMDGKH